MKAVLKNGMIYPQEPLPTEWGDGTELRIEKISSPELEANDDFEQWMAQVQECANESDAEDEMILEQAVQDIRRHERARRIS